MSELAARKIVLASNNPGKVREIQALLDPTQFHVAPQSDFAVLEVDETGSTFVENALIKARNAAQATGLAALADDSGLVVDALNGEPGVNSAYFAGKPSNDLANLNQLLVVMQDVADPDRTARFHCVMVYLRHALDPAPVIAQGIWSGVICRTPAGQNGFGYDPIFYVPTHQCTSAQLNLDTKNILSHRGQALRKLIEQIS